MFVYSKESSINKSLKETLKKTFIGSCIPKVASNCYQIGGRFFLYVNGIIMFMKNYFLQNIK